MLILAYIKYLSCRTTQPRSRSLFSLQYLSKTPVHTVFIVKVPGQTGLSYKLPLVINMWLLHTTSFCLCEFIGQKKPPYAILSHTWGNGEVLFQDVQNLQDMRWKSKPGYKKVASSCHQAVQDGYDYIWIDTCCIDKTSSAELSEAINSMFQWYEASAVCYAFLEDVLAKSDFLKSRWLTRGWTLQELISPRTVRFYNQEWNLLGDRFQLAPEISRE